MPKPLAGIRVIELANFIAGPLAGTLLADMGADVIKVEPPQGDMSRATPPIRNDESVSFVALNRNKRSLVLDLKQPAAREILLRLAAKSDVFLEAYRPGALEKMGLGADDVKKANPKIIYTSVSGFGFHHWTSPTWASTPRSLADSTISGELSHASITASGQRCARVAVRLPGPQPRSTTRRGFSAATRDVRSKKGLPRWSANVR